jgi:hypothetical protein
VAPVPLRAFRAARLLPGLVARHPEESTEAAELEGSYVQGSQQARERQPRRCGLHRTRSKWGNPFRIGIDGDRPAVIVKYERWLRNQHHLLRALDELRGHDLLCFCAPKACHGDLLLRLANASREERIAWWRADAA